MQFYFDPKRESDPHALPDGETFFHQHAKRERCALNADHKRELYGECVLDDEGDCCGTGWYYRACFPGCLSDSEPTGPFETEQAAITAAQDDADNSEEQSQLAP